MPDDAPTAPPALPKVLRFHYIKSAAFRVIHVDGAHGGLTGRGYISASLYSERRPIPQIVEAKVNPDGTLEEETIVEGKDHIVRDVEVNLMFDVDSAKSFRDWLDKRLQQIEDITQQRLSR